MSAIICERVLREEDGTLSAIRMVDVVRLAPVGAASEQLDEAPAYSLFLVVTFKGGVLGTRHGVSITAHAPSGAADIVAESELELSTTVADAPPGFNMIGELQMGLGNLGTYWFEISLNGERVTAVPLTVVPLPPDAPPTWPTPV
jgi:hypothetical protein